MKLSVRFAALYMIVRLGCARDIGCVQSCLVSDGLVAYRWFCVLHNNVVCVERHMYIHGCATGHMLSIAGVLGEDGINPMKVLWKRLAIARPLASLGLSAWGHYAGCMVQGWSWAHCSNPL